MVTNSCENSGGIFLSERLIQARTTVSRNVSTCSKSSKNGNKMKIKLEQVYMVLLLSNSVRSDQQFPRIFYKTEKFWSHFNEFFIGTDNYLFQLSRF